MTPADVGDVVGSYSGNTADMGIQGSARALLFGGSGGAALGGYTSTAEGKIVVAGTGGSTGNMVITVEDHYLEGGLGDAVAGELSVDGIKVHKLAVTALPRSGKPAELLAHFGIDAAGIVKKVKSLG